MRRNACYRTLQGYVSLPLDYNQLLLPSQTLKQLIGAYSMHLLSRHEQNMHVT